MQKIKLKTQKTKSMLALITIGMMALTSMPTMNLVDSTPPLNESSSEVNITLIPIGDEYELDNIYDIQH